MNLRHLVIPTVAIALLAVALHQTQAATPVDVNPFNVPDEVRACLRTHPSVQINGDVNPFYISGDYDGDGKTDFAVQVVAKKDETRGILFCLNKQGNVLMGAGSSTAWPDEDWRFDSWMLIPKGSKQLSIYPRIKFDAIALIVADEGGGLVYWENGKFHWQQEE